MSYSTAEKIAIYHPDGLHSQVVQDLIEAAKISLFDAYVFKTPRVAYEHMTEEVFGLIVASTQDLGKRSPVRGFGLTDLLSRNAKELKRPQAVISDVEMPGFEPGLGPRDPRAEFIDNAATWMWQIAIFGNYKNSGVIVRPVVLHYDEVTSGHEVIKAGVEV